MSQAPRSALLLISAVALVAAAQQTPAQSLGEQLFIEGTALFRAPEGRRDAARGLEKLLASAELRYEHAPYALCIALSSEPEVWNLVESYAWCEVAARVPDRFARGARERALEVLGRISIHEGAESVSKAKARAAEQVRKFQSAA